MSELSQVDIAYLAGIIDGEGCISLHMAKRSSNKSQGGFTFLPTLQVSNTDLGWLEHICKVAGTRCDIQKKPVASKLWKADSYTLRFPPSSVREIVPQIYPFLFVKKVNAEVLLMFFEHGPKREESGRGKFRSDAKFDVCKYLASIMTRLNTRGAGARETKELAIKDFRKFRDQFKG